MHRLLDHHKQLFDVQSVLEFESPQIGGGNVINFNPAVKIDIRRSRCMATEKCVYGSRKRDDPAPDSSITTAFLASVEAQ